MTAREIMGLFDMEVLKFQGNVLFLVLAFTNVCLIFPYWKATDLSHRACRILITFCIIALLYETISKSSAVDALKAIACGFVPVTMLFAYSVLNKKI